MEDLRLRRLAGGSLRPLNRRRPPPRQSRVRLYDRAAVVLAEQDRERAASAPSPAETVAAVFGTAPSPAELWPEGFPRIR